MLLPHPVGPTTATRSPGASTRSRSRSTSRPSHPAVTPSRARSVASGAGTRVGGLRDRGGPIGQRHQPLLGRPGARGQRAGVGEPRRPPRRARAGAAPAAPASARTPCPGAAAPPRRRRSRSRPAPGRVRWRARWRPRRCADRGERRGWRPRRRHAPRPATSPARWPVWVASTTDVGELPPARRRPGVSARRARHLEPREPVADGTAGQAGPERPPAPPAGATNAVNTTAMAAVIAKPTYRHPDPQLAGRARRRRRRRPRPARRRAVGRVRPASAGRPRRTPRPVASASIRSTTSWERSRSAYRSTGRAMPNARTATIATRRVRIAGWYDACTISQPAVAVRATPDADARPPSTVGTRQPVHAAPRPAPPGAPDARRRPRLRTGQARRLGAIRERDDPVGDGDERGPVRDHDDRSCACRARARSRR